ncbi:MAG: hypothetical protein DRQ99_22210 [Candidatus Parabeggiatoa sp. nov. 3]|nr:MAG: hypothetical protein DRQ99_22210 [Gammaproteobacteria bacterium]
MFGELSVARKQIKAKSHLLKSGHCKINLERKSGHCKINLERKSGLQYLYLIGVQINILAQT